MSAKIDASDPGKAAHVAAAAAILFARTSGYNAENMARQTAPTGKGSGMKPKWFIGPEWKRKGFWFTLLPGKRGHKHEYEMVDTNWRECECGRSQVIRWSGRWLRTAPRRRAGRAR